MKQFFTKLVDFFRRFRIIQIILGILLIIAIVYTVAGIIAAKKKITQLNQQYQSADLMVGNELPRIFELRKENAFTEAKLALSKTDSVSLVIDLVDSLVTLELKGVSIHKAKILNFTATSVLTSLQPDALLNLMSTPMKVDKQHSTLVKVPGIVKKAPKDTIEAAQQEEVKDTLEEQRPSFYYFKLNNSIEVTFVHEHKEKNSYFPLFYDQKLKIFRATTDSLKHFKLPEYTPEIRIELHKTDAKTIFRALPNKALVVIRI